MTGDRDPGIRGSGRAGTACVDPGIRDSTALACWHAGMIE